LQAYQFLRRRLVSALVNGDSNHPEAPGRRIAVASLAGMGVALLVSAALLVIGVLRPGGATSWRSGGQVILEKETSTRFVLTHDERDPNTLVLHEVLNYASARLFLKNANASITSVSSRSLAGAPRGRPIGIPGAPESLPAVPRLLTGPWTVCSATNQAPGAPITPPVSVALGASTPGAPLAEGYAVVASVAATRQRYLITEGRRFLLASAAAARALGFGESSADVLVGPTWINAMPAGPDLAVMTVPGAGRPVPALGTLGAAVGDLFENLLPNGVRNFSVATADGLQPITPVEASLIQANPEVRTPLQLTTAQVAAARTTKDLRSQRGFPQELPKLRSLGAATALCATLTPDGDALGVVMDLRETAPGGIAVHRNGKDTTGSASLADRVLVPPGRGALVSETVGGGAASGTLYLVTDQGIRYLLPDADAVKSLGYGQVSPAPTPRSVLDLLPLGPSLDPGHLSVAG
jgi:type VII secretion protein EccB